MGGARVVIIFSILIIASLVVVISWGNQIFSKGMRMHTTKDDRIYVHMIHNTHLDAGWLKTLDEYYRWEVKSILDSVTGALRDSPDDTERVFSYSDLSFLWRWWNDEETIRLGRRGHLQSLAVKKHADFAGGGWVQNDEATPLYDDIIVQMTFGHLFLLDKFNVRPRSGWQLDPFGHSATQAHLSALWGYNGMFITRLDYKDREVRHHDKSSDMFQKTVEGSDEGTLTTSFFEKYSFPKGFVNFPSTAVQEINKHRSSVFEQFVKSASKTYRTNHVPICFGDDFSHNNAPYVFEQTDKLKTFINDSAMHFMYSSPERYIAALHDEKITFPTKGPDDDFFPYSDQRDAYWTGYFTSRPTFKRYERICSQLLQTSEKLIVLHSLYKKNSAIFNQHSRGLFELREAIAVAQHHDALTGTAKQYVSDDYVKMMRRGEIGGHNMIIASMLQEEAKEPTDWSRCHLPFTTICEGSKLLELGAIVVAVFNPQGRSRKNVVVKFPIPGLAGGGVRCTNMGGEVIYSQSTMRVLPRIGPHDDKFMKSGEYLDEQSFVLPEIGALSWLYIRVSPKWNADSTLRKGSGVYSSFEPNVLSNEFFQLRFEDDGTLTSLRNEKSGTTIALTHDIAFYESSTTTGQRSGAYIFRPKKGENGRAEAMTVPFKRRRVVITPQRQCLIRESDETADISTDGPVFVRYCIDEGSKNIEMDWWLPPLYIPNRCDGREYISKWSTNLTTESNFTVDSNGLLMIQKTRDCRKSFTPDMSERESGNYYPMTSSAYIEDSNLKVRFTVFADRAVGVSSLYDGTIEMMIHRRLMHDDGRGVGESLNEYDEHGPIRVAGNHVITMSGLSETDDLYRSTVEENLRTPLLVQFAQPSNPGDIKSGSEKPPPQLPEYLKLLTLSPMPWFEAFEFVGKQRECPTYAETAYGYTLLMRVQHILQPRSVIEGKTFDVEFDVGNYFESFRVNVFYREVTLTANQLKFSWDNERLRFNGETKKPERGNKFRPGDLRTFAVYVRLKTPTEAQITEMGLTHKNCSYWEKIGVPLREVLM